MRVFERQDDLPPVPAPAPCPEPLRRAGRAAVRSLAGWLLLLPGLALLVSASLIASGQELAEARAQRDRVLAAESFERERVDRLNAYADALGSPGEDLRRVLEATHRNRFDAGDRVLALDRVTPDARARVVLAALDPPRPAPEATPGTPDSRLARWSTDDRTRVWVIACGAALVLLGLVPWGARPERPTP